MLTGNILAVLTGRNMKKILTIAVLFLSLVSLAQNKNPQPAYTPPSPPGETKGREEEIRECKAAHKRNNDSSYYSDEDCLRQLEREKKVHTMSCPDSNAKLACRSFQELVAAKDKDLLTEFAHEPQVNICFRPNEDVFFDLWFVEPDTAAFPLAWQENAKAVLEPRFTMYGQAQFLYYKNGVWDEDHCLAVSGKWSSFDKKTIYRFDGSHKGETGKYEFTIVDSRFIVSESFKNEAGSETTHTFTLQRSTGRFTETYQWESLGKPQRKEYSGRCLVL